MTVWYIVARGKNMKLEEGLYFETMPQIYPLYETLRNKILVAYPDAEIKVSKTQISFCYRYIFAMASKPYRRMKGWPKDYLLVSFGLAYQSMSPRIVQSVEAYPQRWTHHVIIEHCEAIDDELMQWIDEAYEYAMIK